MEWKGARVESRERERERERDNNEQQQQRQQTTTKQTKKQQKKTNMREEPACSVVTCTGMVIGSIGFNNLIGSSRYQILIKLAITFTSAHFSNVPLLSWSFASISACASAPSRNAPTTSVPRCSKKKLRRFTRILGIGCG